MNPHNAVITRKPFDYHDCTVSAYPKCHLLCSFDVLLKIVLTIAVQSLLIGRAVNETSKSFGIWMELMELMESRMVKLVDLHNNNYNKNVCIKGRNSLYSNRMWRRHDL